MSKIEWDSALIQKYNYAGPRYTSYPTALEFNENYKKLIFYKQVRSILNVHSHSMCTSHFVINFAISVLVTKLFLAITIKLIPILII